MHKYYSPRWMHRQVNLSGSGVLKLDPADFQNDEVWDMHLHWISIAGNTTKGAGNWSTNQGGVARRVSIQLGISQTGPINLVSADGQSIMGPSGPIMIASDVRDVGVQFNFPTAYRLPRNAGFTIQAQNETEALTSYIGAAFRGFELPDGNRGVRRPVYFGAYGEEEQGLSAVAELEGPDLMNDGDHTAYLTQMILGSAAGESNDNEGLIGTYWRVNPTSGIYWMDPARPTIPAGSIAPFNQSTDDYLDEGPRAYRFPHNTVLKPHQRVSVELTELSAVDQEVHVCLFGMLEVT